MSDQYTVYPDLSNITGSGVQEDSIVSRQLYKDKKLKAILFYFDQDQALSEHKAAQSAILQIVEGEAKVTLGEEVHDLSAGAWVHMEAYLKHTVYAKTPLKMLLVLVP
jgi:quercetin dioxygenase-like cupin family protein